MTSTRIAILQNGLIRGGTERFVINLCRGLKASEKASCEEYDITVINPSLRPEEQILEPEVISTGAKIIHTATIEGLHGRIKHLWKLFWVLRRGSYDVFHTNLDLFNGANLMVAWLAGVPVRICHAHASMQETELRIGRTIVIRLYQRIMRWMCWNFANKHIGCSDLANDFLYMGHDWREATYPTVIPNGIDINSCVTPADTGYIFDTSKKYILVVGRFVLQKNPDFILGIMQCCEKLRPDVHLLWIGDGVFHELVKCKAANMKLSNIEFLGWRDDVVAIMQRASLLLMPSFYEGLSITLIEAQAVGLPCLVSDTITKQAQCGLIQYKSLRDGADSWAETMIRIIDNKSGLMLDNEVIHRFSIEYMSELWKEVVK